MVGLSTEFIIRVFGVKIRALTRDLEGMEELFASQINSCESIGNNSLVRNLVEPVYSFQPLLLFWRKRAGKILEDVVTPCLLLEGSPSSSVNPSSLCIRRHLSSSSFGGPESKWSLCSKWQLKVGSHYVLGTSVSNAKRRPEKLAVRAN